MQNKLRHERAVVRSLLGLTMEKHVDFIKEDDKKIIVQHGDLISKKEFEKKLKEISDVFQGTHQKPILKRKSNYFIVFKDTSLYNKNFLNSLNNITELDDLKNIVSSDCQFYNDFIDDADPNRKYIYGKNNKFFFVLNTNISSLRIANEIKNDFVKEFDYISFMYSVFPPQRISKSMLFFKVHLKKKI